jgi:cell division septal protein FtsQ
MPRKLIAFFCLIGLVLVGLIATKLPNFAFPATHIECSLSDAECPSDLVAQLRPLEGKSLFFTDTSKEVYHLNLERYELITIHKKFPDTIILVFASKKNLYLLQQENSPDVWTVAESGYAQQMSSSEALPTILISPNWSQPLQENTVEPSLHNTIRQLLTELNSNHIEHTSIEFKSSEEIIVHLNNGQQALLTQENLISQVKKLGIISKNVDTKAIDTNIRTIDLRFELPVLKTN